MRSRRQIALALLLPILVAALGGAALAHSGVDPNAAAEQHLGVTYGPYMGLRCGRPVAKAKCERIGIDVVFRRRAASVVAIAGGQRIHLRTPGEHDGVRGRDWVGTFTHAGLAPGSYEAGTNVTRAPVELRVRFASGRRAHARFPGVLIAPGWGRATVADPLRSGWHQVRRPLTGVLLPVQVFAAATYPIVLHHRPGQCGPPRSVLREMPADGALLQVVEYPPRAPDGHPIRVPRLPRRPARFHWSDATWASFECAGPSYKFTYRQAGRALQAQVWLHRGATDPRLRAGALRLLDHWASKR